MFLVTVDDLLAMLAKLSLDTAAADMAAGCHSNAVAAFAVVDCHIAAGAADETAVVGDY